MTRPSQRYYPIQNGISSDVHDVIYHEFPPNDDLAPFVVTVWELRSIKQLSKVFIYHVMPDACIDIIFDIAGSEPPLIMTPHITMESLNLGKEFHYIGVRFYPGALKNLEYNNIVGTHQSVDSIGDVSLSGYADILRDQSEVRKRGIIDALLSEMLQKGCFVDDATNARIITLLSDGVRLSEVSQSVGISERHLRRVIYEYTGFRPVELRRILRFQAVLATGDQALRFADQSHLIKEFGRITGMPYGRFVQLFSAKTR